MPNYNHCAYLQERLDSIFNQSYQNFEVIILDDFSSDKSLNVLEPYRSHPKVSQFVANNRNSGSVFKQWITGITLAKGKYIWIAESDDYADFKFLEETVAFLESNTKYGMVFSDSFKVNDGGHITGQVSKSKPLLQALGQQSREITSDNCAAYLLEHLVIVNASSVLFRKESLFELNFEVLSQMHNAGDVFVYLGLALKSPIYYLPKPLNYMRLHNQNATKMNKRTGLLYVDQIKLLAHYFNSVFTPQNKPHIINFILGFYFLSIDYGYYQQLKELLKKIYQSGLFNKRFSTVSEFISFFYRTVLYKGRPYFMRARLKLLLKKAM
ncbi:glycosyltransferase family 2 protein [Hanstruepera ponticola]|uniref:glycosyltransferase family 2 protein n=1 Tax=Hanstruepera ponticola TaxID=2042995 RepID=UPI001CA9171B|nr:glycosyltransferase [Hanstruepera ponticola]